MFHFHSYKQKIYYTVFVFGFLAAFCISFMAAILLSKSQKSTYLQYLSSSSSLAEKNASVSMSIINKAVQELSSSDAVTQLSKSKSYEDFLYRSIDVASAIQHTTTNFINVDYQMFVTMLHPLEFSDKRLDYIISTRSANSQQDFIKSNPNFSTEELEQVFSYFQANSKPLLLPYYTQDRLKEYHYYVKHTIKGEEFLFLVAIPQHTLTENTSALHYFLYTPDRLLACDQNSDIEHYKNIHQELLRLPSDQHYIYFHSYPVTVASIASTGWNIAYIHEPLTYSILDISIFLLLVLLLFAIFLIMIKQITELLYRPVKEVITDTIAPENITKHANEFDLIRQNHSRIQNLHQEISKAMQENNRLSHQQSLQELIFSASVAPEKYAFLLDPDGMYCFALFNLSSDSSDDSLIPMQKNILSIEAAHNTQMHYVSIDDHHCGMIFQCDTIEQAKLFLFSALRTITEGTDLENTEPYATLSNLHHGIISIHRCYREALKLQEYRPLFPFATIITVDQVSTWDSVTYSYPLTTENLLIQYTISGKEKALELFGDLIHENIRDKDLPSNVMQNLVHALIGTLIRIFQELKTTPDEFLQESIDFVYFYEHWNDSTTITMIKSTLEKIISKVNEQKASSNQVLLQQMQQYIYDNYWDNIMLNDIAEHFNISPKYCGILFKELSNDNFKNFLNSYRVEQAKIFMKKNPAIKINDLSKQVGFNNPKSFLRVFRKYTGVTPSEYLEKLKLQES